MKNFKGYVKRMNRDNLYSVNIHYRYYDLEYFFQRCKDNGFKNIELWLCPQHFLINSYWMEDPKKLLDLIKKYDINVVCITPEQNNPKPNNVSAKSNLLKENTERYFKKVIDLANIIKCSKILITPGWAFNDEPLKEAFQRSVEMLRKLCNYAKEFEIDLVIESIWKQSSKIAYTKEKLHRLIKQVNCSNLKVTLDLGAMGDANETIEGWFKEFGSKIVHCHFVDGKPTGHLPWGRGNRNMYEDLKVFDAYGYTGGFSLEYVAPVSFEDPYTEDKNTVKLFINNINKIAKEKGVSIND